MEKEIKERTQEEINEKDQEEIIEEIIDKTKKRTQEEINEKDDVILNEFYYTNQRNFLRVMMNVVYGEEQIEELKNLSKSYREELNNALEAKETRDKLYNENEEYIKDYTEEEKKSFRQDYYTRILSDYDKKYKFHTNIAEKLNNKIVSKTKHINVKTIKNAFDNFLNEENTRERLKNNFLDNEELLKDAKNSFNAIKEMINAGKMSYNIQTDDGYSEETDEFYLSHFEEKILDDFKNLSDKDKKTINNYLPSNKTIISTIKNSMSASEIKQFLADKSFEYFPYDTIYYEKHDYEQIDNEKQDNKKEIETIGEKFKTYVKEKNNNIFPVNDINALLDGYSKYLDDNANKYPDLNVEDEKKKFKKHFSEIIFVSKEDEIITNYKDYIMNLDAREIDKKWKINGIRRKNDNALKREIKVENLRKFAKDVRAVNDMLKNKPWYVRWFSSDYKKSKEVIDKAKEALNANGLSKAGIERYLKAKDNKKDQILNEVIDSSMENINEINKDLKKKYDERIAQINKSIEEEKSKEEELFFEAERTIKKVEEVLRDEDGNIIDQEDDLDFDNMNASNEILEIPENEDDFLDKIEEDFDETKDIFNPEEDKINNNENEKVDDLEKSN